MAPQEPIIHDPPFPGSIHPQYAYLMLSPISYLNQALISNVSDPLLHGRSRARLTAVWIERYNSGIVRRFDYEIQNPT